MTADGTAPTICLVMIVRDEAHIVTETLASVAAHIDTWSIVDTGSVDDTREVIESFFADAGIDGELHERPWIDFAHNRTEALALARDRADYSLMIDADDLLHGDPDLSVLGADAYLMRIGSGVTYWRTQLFRNDRPWEYRGVLHEYAVCTEPHGPIERLGGDHHIESRRLGARSLVADKYERDAAILAAEHERDPDDARTVFYLAQSLMDAGDPHGAYELYTRRTEMGGWGEEVFWSHLQRARALERMGEAWTTIMSALLDAWNERPSRNEPLVEIARHHRSTGEWELAHLFAARAAEIEFPDDDLLFVSSDSHRWQALDELAIAAFRLGRHHEAWAACDRLLSEGSLPLAERERVLSNRGFSAASILAEPVITPHAVIDRLTRRFRDAAPSTDPARITCTITTCRRLDLFLVTMESFLTNCTDVDLIDRWICIDDGSSAEDLAVMATRFPFLEIIAKDDVDRGHARSMQLLAEMVDGPYWLHLEDDWRFVSRLPYVTLALDVLGDDPTLGQVLFARNFAEELSDREVEGGVLRTTTGSNIAYRIHVHDDDPEVDHRGPHSYWPHFSLRPSLIRTDAVRAAGSFDPTDAHFEFALGTRIAASGFRSAFLDTIPCVHLGPLTRERGPDRRANAYDLNDQPQFGRHRTTTVRLVGNWASPEFLRHYFDRQTQGDGRWGTIRLTDDPNADLTVVLNHPGSERVDPARTIVIHMEPDVGVRSWGPWAAPDRREFLQVRDHSHYPNVAEWHLGATWSELRAHHPVKSRDLSVIVSAKSTDPGQRWRLDLVRNLLDHEVPIDVFGRDPLDWVPDHLGPLPDHDKRNGLFPYRYTIAAENHAEPGYVTEKLFDAILSESLCFHWGCPDLDSIIDPEAWIRLPDDLDAARETITDAIARDLWSERLPAIRRAKQRILDEMQLLPIIERAVVGARRWADTDIAVINLDRRPDRLETFRARTSSVLGDRHASRIERSPAVDGMELSITPELEHLFRGNDFAMRRGVVGCALSHLDLWRRHVASDRSLLLVLEDDVELHDDLRGQLLDSLGALPDLAFDLAFLGHFRWPELPDRRPGAPGQRWRPMRWEEFLGGTFGYLLTRRGARRLLEIAERDGIQNGIDWFPMRHQHELVALEHLPFLITAPLAWPGRSGDSDIQHDLTPVAPQRSTDPHQSER